MVKCFKCGELERSCVERETLAETERLLQLHSYETCDLIHRYYMQRYREQTKMNDTPYGQLTIRGHFTADDCLEVSKFTTAIANDSYSKMFVFFLALFTVGNS